MSENATKEERLMVQVAQLQVMLSNSEVNRDRWRECAGKLYDELRVRGVSESVSRDGAGCIELFEAMDVEEYA